jgi:hypothetical protein
VLANLFEGHALRLALHLSAVAEERPELATELEREAGCFRKHQGRMRYQPLREDGRAIGSGMVESAAKQFKGMRWSRTGSTRLIPVRAAIVSYRFEKTWKTAHHSSQNRKAPSGKLALDTANVFHYNGVDGKRFPSPLALQ